MKLSIDGLFRLAAQAAFVSGLAAASFVAVAQEASGATTAPPADTAPAPIPAPDATALPPAAVDTLSVAAVPAPAAPSPVQEKSIATVELKKISVTGSRIKSPNLNSTSPITTVGSAEVKAQGTTRVEDLLNSLPQVFADQGGNLSNGASGTATVDLRDLGASRTLVLIDGKRVQPGDPGDSTADLNFIPAALIDRVDVLTGGASSTYGADAVAGVVNFVMKKNFEGVRLEAQRGIYNHKNDSAIGDIVAARSVTNPSQYRDPATNKWDGQSWDATVLLGTNTSDGKGNVTAYATYRQIDAVDQGARDTSACGLNRSGTRGFVCGGSSTSATGRFFGNNADSSNEDLDITLNPTGTGDTFRPFSGGRDNFNFNPFNYFQRNDERYTLGSFANFEINEHANVYASVMYLNDRTNAVIAPSGAFGVGYTLRRDNPLLSDAAEQSFFADQPADAESTDILVLRRNVEGGGRDDDLRHSSFRVVSGIKGALIADWEYDASVQYGKTERQEVYRNDFSIQRVGRALDVVDDGNGNAVCRSFMDGSDPGCVPWNIYRAGGVTPAALNYLQTPGLSIGVVEERIATGSVSGPSGFKFPFANDDVALAFGAEYRDETSIFENDLAFNSGDLAGQGAPQIDTRGSFDVKELFAETRIPFIQDQPLVKEFNIELGYRYSDYSSTAATDTYKVAGNYAPVSDINFRVSYNRAVRAPNIGEIAAPTRVGIDGGSDPCAGQIDPATGVVSGGATAAQCANDPLIKNNPGLYGNIRENPAGQYNGLLGTDPGLSVEKADTYTVGFVFTPTFVKGLSLSVDYFNIKVDGFIAGYGYDTIVTACYERGALCDLIQRDTTPGAARGSLWLTSNGFVVDTTQNTGQLKVAGIDFKGDYRIKAVDLGLPAVGTFVVDYVGTVNAQQKITPIPGDPSSAYNCSGLYGVQCGAPVSRWRHKLRTTWNTPWYDSSLSLGWRYIGEVKADTASVTNSRYAKLKGQSYFDLSSNIRFAKKYTVRAGVNNVLDNEAPIVGNGVGTGGQVNGNTYPQVYDALGRFIFTSVTLDF